MGHSSKPPPSASLIEVPPAEDPPAEVGKAVNSNSDLKFLNQVASRKCLRTEFKSLLWCFAQDDANSSAELISFHEAVYNLIEAEELLVEKHKSTILVQKCISII